MSEADSGPDNFDEPETGSRTQAGAIPAVAVPGTYVPEDQPAFMVGVTGHMDPGNDTDIKELVKQLFWFLKYGNSTPEGRTAATCIKEKLPALVNLDKAREANPGFDPKKAYDDFFSEWQGLGKTPIIVLSSLAPGADQIVARTALEPEFKAAGFHLRCPFPFPREIYRESVSFVRKVPDDATDATRKEIEAANIQRQEEFDELVVLIEGDHFTVAIEDDLELALGELTERYEVDGNDDRRRNWRFRGVGEYIAAYSHLMIAIWDHIGDTENDEGTAEIVHARRNGLTRGLLPTTPDLPLPADGPTLHIYANRQDRQGPDPPIKLRWLFACTSKEQMPSPYGNSLDPADASWLQGGLTRFLRRTELLVEFATRDSVDGERAKDQLNQLLRDGRSNMQDLLKDGNTILFGMIKRLVDFRRRAADEQRDREAKEAQRTLIWLFWLSLLAACFSHASNHWHSQLHVAKANHEQQAGNQPSEKQKVVAVTGRTGLETLDVYIRFLIGVFGFALVCFALVFFSKRRPQQHNEKSDDLRAIAEGARVQLMWHMAGVGKSVSSNYMQRQRGELSWIRQAISSVGMPYERAKWLFDALSPALQIGLLRCVYYNWIRGHNGAQTNYFEKTRKDLVARIHFWHKTGFVLALAGLWLVLLNVVASLFAIFELDLFLFLSPMSWNSYACWILVFPATGALLIVGTVMTCGIQLEKRPQSETVLERIGRRLRNLWSLISSLPKFRTAWRRGWEKARKNYFDHVVEWLVPTVDAKTAAHSSTRFYSMIKLNFYFYATRGLVVAIFALLAGNCFAHCWLRLPGLESWVNILAAWLLICGGLSLAWPERNLCSELAYQYSTMETLFSLAADRIEPMIDELADLHLTSTDRTRACQKACFIKSRLPETERAVFDCEQRIAEIQTEAGAEYARQLRRIQGALFDLGKEALDENAEWLILHRARPLEPVMAG